MFERYQRVYLREVPGLLAYCIPRTKAKTRRWLSERQRGRRKVLRWMRLTDIVQYDATIYHVLYSGMSNYLMTRSIYSRYLRVSQGPTTSAFMERECIRNHLL
jgi:hypothetical protein